MGCQGTGEVISTGCAEGSRQPPLRAGACRSSWCDSNSAAGFRCGHSDAALLFWASDDGLPYTVDPQ